MLKARPELMNDSPAQLWSRFFCLSVYVTMYLNDHQRAAFYASLGLNTTQFNQHVIIETNKTTDRIFPEVPDVEHPQFFVRMDRMVAANEAICAISNSDAPDVMKTLRKLPHIRSLCRSCLHSTLGRRNGWGRPTWSPQWQPSTRCSAAVCVSSMCGKVVGSCGYRRGVGVRVRCALVLCWAGRVLGRGTTSAGV